MRTKLTDKLNKMQEELNYLEVKNRTLTAENLLLKQYSIQPGINTLIIALEKVTDCVAHTLNDMRRKGV